MGLFVFLRGGIHRNELLITIKHVSARSDRKQALVQSFSAVPAVSARTKRGNEEVLFLFSLLRRSLVLFVKLLA